MSRAVLTMVYNEPVFLPIWLRYYSRFFAPEDIYVLDHRSNDGSTDGGGFVRIPLEHETNDDRYRVRMCEAQQRELLERYDVVLTTDVDEIVAPDPRCGTLADYIEGFSEEFVNCTGYELLHLKDAEPPLAVDRPIFEQRRHWYRNPGYDKPLLATVPLSWVPGFHTVIGNRRNPDPGLRLIHLHRMDYGICLARHRARQAREFDPDDVETGRGYHNRIVEEADFQRWFYEDSCFEMMGIHIDPEEIPEEWRGLV
jgi:glycosyl transferase family 2